MTPYPSHLLLPDGTLLPVTAPVATGDVLRHGGRLYLATGTCRDVPQRGKPAVYARCLCEVTVRELATGKGVMFA